MAHEIETTRAAYAVKPAWHKIGTVVDADTARDPSPHVMQTAARMQYAVSKGAVLVEHNDALNRLAAMARADSVFGSAEIAAIVADLARVDGQNHLVRSDDRRVVSPCTVSNGYEPIHPQHLVDVLTPWVASGWARWDAMFVLRNGQEEVVTVKLELPEEFRIDGDESAHDTYLFLRNRHGRGSVQGLVTTVRAVCANTVSAAISGGIDFSVRHGRNVVTNLEAAAKSWEEARTALAQYKASCGILAGVECNIETAVNTALGLNAKKREDWTPAETKRQAAVLAGSNRADDGTFGRTLYDVWNGVTNFLTHSDRSAKTVEKRLSAQLDGSRAKLERAAFGRLLELATAE